MISNRKAPRYFALTCIALALLSLPGNLATYPTSAAAVTAPPEGFAHAAIRAVWQRDDAPVASGQVERTWMWGPGPFFTNYEPYREARDGHHLVQYFDKGRLEVNDPTADDRSPWFVTSGLLVKEMVSGDAQVGDDRIYSLGPATVPVAGESSDQNAPTYASFARLTERAENRTGEPVDAEVDAAGNVKRLSPMPEVATSDRSDTLLGGFEEASGHNWAGVFRRFATSPDRPAGFDWLYVLGYPLTEPYWARVTVAGKPQLVLVQLFERRTLTFNPSNPPATQVEMGNVGRHYYLWRYANTHPADLDASYDVRVSIGSAPARATRVEEKIALTNATGTTLDRVVFRAVWRHWDGVFNLQSASVDGRPVETAWLSGINLEVRLPAPLPDGARTTLSLSFDIKPRPVGGRTGYDKANDILSLGDALPTVVPWENGGWLYYPYSRLGDYGYYDSAAYKVEILSTGGERLIVGGTGKVASVDAKRTRWLFEARDVRDVAYVVSPYFVDPLAEPAMTRRAGNTQMLAYFLPEHRADGQRQLDLTAPALDWFGDKIGAYPFDTYVVAEMGVPLERTDNYAQEYPMAYFVPTSWLRLGTTAGSWTWYIPVHEVGHQWFYSSVGSNQVIHPWLDEAMTSYITAEYVRARFPEHYSRAWASMSSGADLSRPVSSGQFSGLADEDQYTAVIYAGGVQMLDRVRRAMGDADFYAALGDYYAKFRHKRATPNDLLGTLQAHSKADLKGIFAEYLGY